MRQAPPPLRLFLHGHARVVRADGQVLALRGRAAGLAALCALEPGISRESAAVLLWPDSARPRQTLRQQLLRFRQALGRPLLDGDPGLDLAPGVQVQPAVAGEELLADEVPGDDDWGQWLARRRQQDVQARCGPLQQALAAAEAEGALDRALQLARELLALDPQGEASHAQLMRLHYLRGEPAAGLAVYAQLEQMLRDQLGARPSAASQALATALRQGQAAATTAPAAALPANRLPVTLKRPPVMAGRQAELAAALAALASGRAVLVEGEAGLGKSRLLAECRARLQGTVLQAAGRPGDSGTPYSSLARLLKPLLAAGSAALGPAARDALARIGAIDGIAPATDGALPTGALQAAVTECLAQAAVQTVVLDDLHFADAASLELVSALLADDSPCRWLLAQRPAEVPPAAVALRQALTELQRLSVVALAPLDSAAAAELVDALAVPGLDGAAMAAALVQHSGGNPLFMLETLKQGLQDGSLARGELPRPPSVQALIEQRLQRLSEDALALVRVAAIAGVDFCVELAESAIGLRAVQLASAWRELQDAQLLRDEALTHDLVADAARRGVPPVVARRVHAQCAAWLAQHGGQPARVARHWRDGGRPREAAAAFEHAARRAREAARQVEEAEFHAQAAQAHADAGQGEARFEALANRVAALIGARSDEAALAEARALPDHATNDVQRVRALRVLTDQLGQRGPFEEAIEVGLRGIALARRIGAQPELARLAGVTAGNQLKLGRTDDAYSLLLPLRDWVDREADDEVRQIWYGYWAALLGHTGRLREGVASYEVSIACAERTGARPNLSMALINQSVVLRTMGALPRATEVCLRGLDLLNEDADSAQYRLARLMHARNQAETGELGPAQQALDVLLPQFEAMGAPFWVHALRATQARLWQHLGQHARALQALQMDDTGQPAWMQAGRLWLRLEIGQWLGTPAPPETARQALALLDADANRRTSNAVRGLRFATAQAVLEQADALAHSAARLELFGTVAALAQYRAQAAMVLHRHDEAAACARQLLGLLDEGYVPDFVYTPEAWLVAGQALRAAGDPAGARLAFGAGLLWVRGKALPQVPAPFIDSFLHRNPVNRDLLALASPAG